MRRNASVTFEDQGGSMMKNNRWKHGVREFAVTLETPFVDSEAADLRSMGKLKKFKAKGGKNEVRLDAMFKA